jgi:tRNA(fMet)-specific endonuclease VapC
MKRFLFDSGIASDYLNRRHGVFERARAEVANGNHIGIGLPVLAELVGGIEHSQTRDRNMQRLRNALPTLKLWPFDPAAAFEYGRLYADLARRGRPMQTVDIMIAAIARTLARCTLVSADSDLDDIPGLTIENWCS